MAEVLSVITAPAVEPVSLAEARLHLKIATTADDTLIEALIVAARSLCEVEQKRALINQTLELTLDRFPGGCRAADWAEPESDAIALPRPPLVSVTSIKYDDPDGVEQTLGSGAYRVVAGTPGRIAPAYGTTWPATRDQLGAVRVRYLAGYGATAAAVPGFTKAGILLAIGHLYENREAVNVGNIVAELPLGVSRLWAAANWGCYR